jgi:hypothetical protein
LADVDRDPTDIVPAQLDLAGVKSRAHLNA